MREAGLARRDNETGGTLVVPGTLGVERITVRDLDEGTVAQGVRFLGSLVVQVSDRIPHGARMGAARHFVEYHRDWCTTADCQSARDWLGAESIRGPACAPPLASA
jgi:hypothetical protein